MQQSFDQTCLHTALRLLSRRDHSCGELSAKLRQRGFGPAQIRFVLAECQRLNYLNDHRFAHHYMAQLRRKGYGPLRIQQILQTKGLASELVNSCLIEYNAQAVEARDCRRVLAKKLKSLNRLQNQVPLKARLYRFLSGRGFSSAIIRQTLNEVLRGDDGSH